MAEFNLNISAVVYLCLAKVLSKSIYLSFLLVLAREKEKKLLFLCLQQCIQIYVLLTNDHGSTSTTLEPWKRIYILFFYCYFFANFLLHILITLLSPNYRWKKFDQHTVTLNSFIFTICLTSRRKGFHNLNFGVLLYFTENIFKEKKK